MKRIFTVGDPLRPIRATFRAPFRATLALFLLLASTQAAQAAEGPWAEREMAQARLIAATDAVGAQESLAFGLQIALEPGWKTYWRSPGDAGVPPTLDWSQSTNVAAVDFAWPAPIRFTLFGLDTFGYEEEVVFPLTVTPERPGEPVVLDALVTYMVCEEVCIPLEERLTLALPAGPAQPGAAAYPIESFRARVPGDGGAAGLSLGEASLSGTLDRPVLELTAISRIAFTAPDLIVEGPAGYFFRKPAVTLSDDGKQATLRLEANLGPQVNQPLEGAPLTLTLVEGHRALEATLVPGGALAAGGDGLDLPVALAPSDLPTLAAMLGLALLGGLILNLMPCVLPVLSLKLLSVVGQGGRARGEIRRSFLASAAGILVSFLLLASGLIALKAGGAAIGWGVQFQSPLFLGLMAAVVTLFAANLFGFFEVPLPGAVSGLAGGGGGHHGLKAHFLTGFLATLLATPCSAPFLGTAVGFALAKDWPEILAIFVALGLGLALPYLLVALFPGLAQRLPRPGRWMAWLRRVLGLALLGTAAWLVSVLWQQVGVGAALAVAALLLLGFALLALRRRAAAARPLLAAAAALSLLAAVALALAWPARPGTATLAAGWEPFEAAAIPGMVAEGNTVFVDVTAEWCVTCIANKRLVLDTAEVAAALDGEGVVAMQADWTRPDPAISDFLQRYGRYGIPFNIVFGPGAPQGLPLPELLSREAVLEALAEAGRRGPAALSAR